MIDIRPLQKLKILAGWSLGCKDHNFHNYEGPVPVKSRKNIPQAAGSPVLGISFAFYRSGTQ